MPITLNSEAMQAAIRTAKNIESISIRVDRNRRLYVWSMQAEGREPLEIEGGPEQLPGMLLCAQGLLCPELHAPAVLGMLGQN